MRLYTGYRAAGGSPDHEHWLQLSLEMQLMSKTSAKHYSSFTAVCLLQLSGMATAFLLLTCMLQSSLRLSKPMKLACVALTDEDGEKVLSPLNLEEW